MNDAFGHIPSAGLVWAIPGLPLLGFLAIMFGGGRAVSVLGPRAGRRLVGGLATALVAASFVLSVLILGDLVVLDPERRRMVASLLPIGGVTPWIDVGAIHVHYQALIDPLSVVMCLVVTGVGALIHLYATGYMGDDRDYPRFFAYFNLFIAAMLVLVLGESILVMFVGWEGVGLCSYLLISFWYEDADNARAGNKAFIVNRVGDVGFALGIMTILAVFGTLSFHTATGSGFLDMAARKATAHGALTTGTATLIAILLFAGACGKSAQFPLHIWLPDAMAGPTPVSALIHAATMVTAGVVMVTRMSVIFVQAPVVMTVVAVLGLFTALFAATIALTQTDIKKVLAYSTVSQLGFMFLGCGAGAFAAGVFHVTTHAFFKALLFLGAGSVIHGLSGEQDMRRMGGLSRHMRITFATMVAGWAAISGFPALSGFWSKDAILGFGAGVPRIGFILYAVGTITAVLTGLYMTRLMSETFWGGSRLSPGSHPHESPPSMLIPLVVLAILSVCGGWIGTPWANAFERFLETSLPAPQLFTAHEGVPVPLGLAIGALVGVGAMTAGALLYRRDPGAAASERKPGALYAGARNLWYVDACANAVFVRGGGRAAIILWQWVDQGIVDRLVNALAFLTGLTSEIARGFQSGYVRVYVTTMLGGALALLLWSLMTAGVR